MGVDESECKGKTKTACSIECKYDKGCVGFTHDEEDTCCLANGVGNIGYKEGTDLYLKDVDGFSVSELGDKTGETLATYEDTDLMACGDLCRDTANCGGMSAMNGVCDLKFKNGLSSTYYDTGLQFYTNNNVQSAMVYEFFIEVPHDSTIGHHINDVLVDGIKPPAGSVTLYKDPDRNENTRARHIWDGDASTMAAYNDPQEKTERFMKIVLSSRPNKFTIRYGRPLYAPGWLITENGVEIIKETANRGSDHTPTPIEYDYVLP